MSKKAALFPADRHDGGNWLRTCRNRKDGDHEFIISGPLDRKRTCPDCIGERGAPSSRPRNERLREGATARFDDDPMDVRDRGDPDEQTDWQRDHAFHRVDDDE